MLVAAVIALSLFYMMDRLIGEPVKDEADRIAVTSFRFDESRELPEPPKPNIPPPPERRDQPPPTGIPELSADSGRAEIALPDSAPEPGKVWSQSELPESTGVPGGDTQAAGDRSAQPVLRVEPPYPAKAAAEGIEGWVRLRLTVAANGEVTEARVLDAQPRGVFEKAARRAAVKWRFRPQVVDGRRVSQHVTQTVDFELDDSR